MHSLVRQAVTLPCSVKHKLLSMQIVPKVGCSCHQRTCPNTQACSFLDHVDAGNQQIPEEPSQARHSGHEPARPQEEYHHPSEGLWGEQDSEGAGQPSAHHGQSPVQPSCTIKPEPYLSSLVHSLTTCTMQTSPTRWFLNVPRL